MEDKIYKPLSNLTIIEGPDKIGKTTLAKYIKDIYTKSDVYCSVMHMPDRPSYPKEINDYYMGNSDASMIERQFYITLNNQLQYTKLANTLPWRNGNRIISDRNTLISSIVYGGAEVLFPPMQQCFRVIQESFVRTFGCLGVVDRTLIILTGDRPRVELDAGEFFESGWDKKNKEYAGIPKDPNFNFLFSKCKMRVFVLDVYKYTTIADLAAEVIGIIEHKRGRIFIGQHLDITVSPRYDEGEKDCY